MKIFLGVGLILPPNAGPSLSGSPLAINGTPPDGIVGKAYSWTPSISGGTAPYSVALTGTLPNGLSLNTTTGAITGTPTTNATFSGLNLTVTDAVGATASLGVFDIAIAPALDISGTPGTATEGVAYSWTPTTIGGRTPYSFALTAGTLASGFSFNTTTGAITSNTSTVDGVMSGLQITVTDANGDTDVLGPFSLTVIENPPGQFATAFTTAPSVHHHPHTVSVTKDGGGRITASTDLRGLANLAVAAGIPGPLEMTDALGRKCWLWDGTALLRIATTYAINPRGYTMVMVLRPFYHSNQDNPLLTQGPNGSGTAPASSTAPLSRISSSSATLGNAPVLYASTKPGVAATAIGDKRYMYIGTQLQVIAIASRANDIPGANNGQLMFCNNNYIQHERSAASSAWSGGTIGDNAPSPASSGSKGKFLLYEFALWNTGLSDAAAAQAVSEAVTNWAIPQITGQVVVEGDSQWTHNLNVASEPMSALLSTPGGVNALPADWRVVQVARNGSSSADILGRLSQGSSITALSLLPGGPQKNIVLLHIGGNDMNAGQTASQVAANITAILSGNAYSYLPKGFSAAVAIKPPYADTGKQTVNLSLRTLMRSSTFLTDNLAGPGQTYDGLLHRMEYPLITVGGSTIMDEQADASNLTYFNADGEHPTAARALVELSGGDPATAQYGVKAAIELLAT